MMPRKYAYPDADEVLAVFETTHRVMTVAEKFHIPYGLARKIIVSRVPLPKNNRLGPDLPDILPPLPPLKPYSPRTVPNGQISESMRLASLDRRFAGPEPLPPGHPISKAALPRLRSLENAS